MRRLQLNQAIKHFDSAQCDIRLESTLFHLNAQIINSIRCPPERSRRIKRTICNLVVESKEIYLIQSQNYEISAIKFQRRFQHVS